MLFFSIVLFVNSQLNVLQVLMVKWIQLRTRQFFIICQMVATQKVLQNQRNMPFEEGHLFTYLMVSKHSCPVYLYSEFGQQHVKINKMKNIFITLMLGLFYILTEGTLYYKKGKRQVVYHKEAAKQIFYKYHVSAGNAHCGIVKTRNAVCKLFYWPGITTDIHKWVSMYLYMSNLFMLVIETTVMH